MVIKTVDVSYGGENGFNQAIELAGETLGSVKLIQVRACIDPLVSAVSSLQCAPLPLSIRSILPSPTKNPSLTNTAPL